MQDLSRQFSVQRRCFSSVNGNLCERDGQLFFGDGQDNESSRSGVRSMCAFCLSVKLLVWAFLYGLVWYYQSVGFQLLSLDGHCFERTSLFEMAVDRIPTIEVKWNSSEVVYQNCLCETACWWAHPRSLENRVQCWHACSTKLHRSEYVFWRGSDVFVPHLGKMFDAAHDEMRQSWAEQGLPEHFADLQYYWIAK